MNTKRKIKTRQSKLKMLAGKTWGEKIALTFDPKSQENAITRFVEGVFGLRELLADPNPPPNFKGLPAEWMAESQRQFAEVWFPALINDKPAAFLKLVEAMATVRRKSSGRQRPPQDLLTRALLVLFHPGPTFTVTPCGKLKKVGTYHPSSMRVVIDQLDAWEVPYGEETAVYRRMDRLGIPKPRVRK